MVFSIVVDSSKKTNHKRIRTVFCFFKNMHLKTCGYVILFVQTKLWKRQAIFRIVSEYFYKNEHFPLFNKILINLKFKSHTTSLQLLVKKEIMETQ